MEQDAVPDSRAPPSAGSVRRPVFRDQLGGTTPATIVCVLSRERIGPRRHHTYAPDLQRVGQTTLVLQGAVESQHMPLSAGWDSTTSLIAIVGDGVSAADVTRELRR